MANNTSAVLPGGSIRVDRTPSSFYLAAARVELDLYNLDGSLYGVYTGVPSSYRIWKNSGFNQFVDTGRYQSSCGW